MNTELAVEAIGLHKSYGKVSVLNGVGDLATELLIGQTKQGCLVARSSKANDLHVVNFRLVVVLKSANLVGIHLRINSPPSELRGNTFDPLIDQLAIESLSKPKRVECIYE